MICPKCGLTIEGRASRCPRCLAVIPKENQDGAANNSGPADSGIGSGYRSQSTGRPVPPQTPNYGGPYQNQYNPGAHGGPRQNAGYQQQQGGGYQQPYAPQPGAQWSGNPESPIYWIAQVFKKYAVFDGRARRKEYWLFTLFNCIISFVLSLFLRSSLSSFMMYLFSGYGPSLGILGFWGILLLLYNIAVFSPSLAVGVRRLHDTGRSGYNLLLSLIPIVGAILLIVYLAEDSKPGPNQYGPNPKTP
ncbi:MAG: DUF805 domain-containing protein [Treponema sp.]|jgi:uncharacterized membrane protein YhaH (DUF805 family)|nr:DUF805 domain-containing protein [Treponema sp.]